MEWEAVLRLTSFFFVLIVMTGAERFWPKRTWREARARHWLRNISLLLLNTVVLRLTLGAAAVSAAYFAQTQNWGILNLVNLPFWAGLIIALIALDCLIYWQHRLFHVVPILWRLHQVHHADVDLDATTGLRFHPFEILLSMLIKVCVVVIFGFDPVAVVVFEILLNASSMFNHSNVSLSLKVDALLRRVIVTPDMHRIHHSVLMSESNSNYGFFMSIWDKLFHSYTPAPQNGHRDMLLGLSYAQKADNWTLKALLMMPFR